MSFDVQHSLMLLSYPFCFLSSSLSLSLSTFSQSKPKLPPPRHLATGCLWTEVPLIEIARQMCLIDWHLVRHIRKYELAFYGPTTTRHRHTPNILAVVKRFMNVAKWVSTEVRKEARVKGRWISHEIFCPLQVIMLSTPKQRAKMMTHCIELASQLHKFHNYAGTRPIGTHDR